MLPSSNGYHSSSKSRLISTSSSSSSRSSLQSVTPDLHGANGSGSGGHLSSSNAQQQADNDVTAETSLADSQPAFKTNELKVGKVNAAMSSSSLSSRDTSYPSSSASSSSRGLSSSESSSGNGDQRHRHHGHHGQKGKQLRKLKPEAQQSVATAATSSSSSSASSSSDSGSISPCPSSASSTTSLNDNQHKNHKKTIDNNDNNLNHKRGDVNGNGATTDNGKRFKLFNFLKIKPPISSGLTKSKTVDQIKCICHRGEKKFDCLKCTSNYPVHVNRSRDGEEGGGRSSQLKLQRHDLNAAAVVQSNDPGSTTSAPILSQPINSSNGQGKSARPPLVVSVPVRRADGSSNINSNGQQQQQQQQNYNRMAARKTMPEFHEQHYQSMMPNSKTYGNLSSSSSASNPVPYAASTIKLKPSPFPVSNQLMSFLEQLNPSNSFKVPPNVSPFT